MNNATQIQKLVYSMITENTGSHFLDSGSIYGRNWERNKKKSIRDFINEPSVKYYLDSVFEDCIKDSDKYINREVSVFHYITSQFELDNICDRFNRLNKNAKDWDGEYYGVSKKAQKFLDDLDAEFIRDWNTYNNDSDLSQILQGTDFKIFVDGTFENYVLIQIHNGCDARTGYTDAKLFKRDEWADFIQEYMSQDDIIRYELEYIDVYDAVKKILTQEEKEQLFELTF